MPEVTTVTGFEELVEGGFKPYTTAVLQDLVINVLKQSKEDWRGQTSNFNHIV